MVTSTLTVFGFLFFIIAYVLIFMARLILDSNANYFSRFFFIQVLLQNGEQRKVVAICYTFSSTTKRTFKIDVAVSKPYSSKNMIMRLNRPV